MHTFTEAAIETIELATEAWEQGAAASLMSAVSRQNLPGPITGGNIWSELAQLKDVGCAKADFGVGQEGKKEDRHSFGLWTPTVTCADASSAGNRKLCSFTEVFKDRSPCLVFAVGSHGEFSFEEEFLRATNHCVIVTLDCTCRTGGGTWNHCDDKFKTPVQLSERHWFYPYCVSAEDSVPTEDYMTIATVMKKLGHAPGSLSLLKIDIEAFEHDVFQAWRSSDPHLPEQILTEVHCTTEPISGKYRWRTVGELTSLLQHMIHVGYRLSHVQREGGGIDATFVRVQCPQVM
jgi:hypothetical protein